MAGYADNPGAIAWWLEKTVSRFRITAAEIPQQRLRRNLKNDTGIVSTAQLCRAIEVTGPPARLEMVTAVGVLRHRQIPPKAPI